MKSPLFTLNWKDALKAVIVAVITALVTGVYQLIQTGSELNMETLKPVLLTSVSAGLAYIIKNFFTNSDDKLLTSEKK